MFPCNQYAKQEPWPEPKIKEFAAGFGILDLDPPACDMYQKCDVNGDKAHDVFKFVRSAKLPNQAVGEAVGWNFAKFVIDHTGQVIHRAGPGSDPEKMDTPELMEKWLTDAVEDWIEVSLKTQTQLDVKTLENGCDMTLGRHRRTCQGLLSRLHAALMP